MSQKIGTLRLALTFAGCFLGAGYVSGQELWQYFGAFGARGLLGLVLAVALLGGTGVLLLRLSARTGIETMDALIVRADIPWLRTVVGVLTAVLLFGVVCIMAAGIGALGEQMLGLPVWLGAAIACVLIAAAAYFGLGGMVSVFTVAVPCMIVAALVIAGIRLHRTGLTAAAFAAGDTNPMLGNWATSAVNYAAYNFFATVGILAPLTRHLKKPGTAVWGTVLGCVLLLAVALGVLAALAVSPESVGAQLPMLDLACRHSRRCVRRAAVSRHVRHERVLARGRADLRRAEVRAAGRAPHGPAARAHGRRLRRKSVRLRRPDRHRLPGLRLSGHGRHAARDRARRARAARGKPLRRNWRLTRSGRPDTMKAMTNTAFSGIFTGGTAMKHLKRRFACCWRP